MKGLSADQVKAAADRAEARADGKDAAETFVAVALTEGELNAEVAKLAALPVGVYESERVTAAKRLNMRATVLDKLVAAARPKPEDAGRGSTIELVTRAPAESKIDGAALLASIAEQIGVFIFLPEHERFAIALWIVASYAFDSFFIFPRLRLRSPTKGCGKSTLLDILECLVNKPLTPSNITGPALFRVIAQHRPTMLLDEGDRYVNGNDDLISVIDAGHKKNGVVLRCVGDDQEVRTFSVWAPMAIAAIRALAGTVEDRSILIAMHKKPADKKLRRFRADRPPPELATLASQAARWAADHQIALGNADPAIPEQLGNRSSDNWLPLFAVADAASGSWPEKARRAAQQIQRFDDDDLNVRLLADVREIFKSREMHSRDLVAALNEQEGAPWATISHGRALTQSKMARMLGDFGIKPEQIKIGGTNLNGYRLDQFAPAFAAYPAAQNVAQAAHTPLQTSTASTALKTQEKSAFQTSTSESAGRGLESEIPKGEQSGRPGRGLNSPVEPNGYAGQVCAHCGWPADNQPLLVAGDGKRAALLHRRCEVPFFTATSDDEPGEVILDFAAPRIEETARELNLFERVRAAAEEKKQ